MGLKALRNNGGLKPWEVIGV